MSRLSKMSFALTMSMMENEDPESRGAMCPEQRRRAAHVLKRFSDKYLSQGPIVLKGSSRKIDSRRLFSRE